MGMAPALRDDCEWYRALVDFSNIDNRNLQQPFSPEFLVSVRSGSIV